MQKCIWTNWQIEEGSSSRGKQKLEGLPLYVLDNGLWSVNRSEEILAQNEEIPAVPDEQKYVVGEIVLAGLYVPTKDYYRWHIGKVIEVLKNGNYIVEIEKNMQKTFQIGEFVRAEKTKYYEALELAEIIGVEFKDFILTKKRNPKFGEIVYRHRNELSKIEIASFRIVEVDGKSRLLKVHPVDIRKLFQVGEVVSVKLDDQKFVQATVVNGINKHEKYRLAVKIDDGHDEIIESYPVDIEHIFYKLGEFQRQK
uniref:Uncharacterized protein n=1 Tax=Meloidogyne javanica TaxID=6303 RepID=A0A915N4T7_MELJA